MAPERQLWFLCTIVAASFLLYTHTYMYWRVSVNFSVTSSETMAKAWSLVVVLLLRGGNALDIMLEKITCNENLPVSVVEKTFQITCDGRKACSFSGHDTALVKGHCKVEMCVLASLGVSRPSFFSFYSTVILSGVNNADGMSGTKVFIEAHVEIMTANIDLVDGAVVDLCYDGSSKNGNNAYNGDDKYNGDDAYNGDDTYNGDDAYNGDYAYNGDDEYNAYAYSANDDNNGNGCPADGVYAFETYVAIPQQRNTWMATGWSASGEIIMYSSGSNVIGTCNMSFSTSPTHSPASSRTIFALSITVLSLVLFVCVFVGSRRWGGFNRKDDARMFQRMGDDFVQSTCSLCCWKRKEQDAYGDSIVDTRITHDAYGDQSVNPSTSWLKRKKTQHRPGLV
jgi:hypothetical protein